MKNNKESKENIKAIKVLKGKFDIIDDKKPKNIDLTLKKPKTQKIVKEIIDDSMFLQLLMQQQKQNFSPSLNQVEIATPATRATDLEQQLGFNSQTQNNLENKDNKDDPFKYSVGEKDSSAPKYTSSREENERVIQTQRTNPLEFRREKPFETNIQEMNRSGFFEQKTNSKSIETYVPVKNFDKDKIRKGDPFEKENVQYSPSDY